MHIYVYIMQLPHTYTNSMRPFLYSGVRAHRQRRQRTAHLRRFDRRPWEMTGVYKVLASLHPNSENLRIPWFHRTLDLALWIHCFPNLLSCVIDWLRWEDLSTQYVDALCCSAYALEPGWAQIISPRWIPNPDNLRRRGLSNIVWLLCSMTWDYMSPLFSIWGIWGNLGMLGLISTAHTQKSTHSTGDIALRAHIQKSSYSARILRNHRTRQMGAHTAKIEKNRKKKEKEPAEFFFSFLG